MGQTLAGVGSTLRAAPPGRTSAASRSLSSASVDHGIEEVDLLERDLEREVVARPDAMLAADERHDVVLSDRRGG